MSNQVVSLPSIHEMFPEHLLKATEQAPSHRHHDSLPNYRYTSREPPSPYLPHPHPVQDGSRRTGALPPSSRSPYLTSRAGPSSHSPRPSHTNSLQSSFNVLRSDPTSSSLKHLGSSATLPNRDRPPNTHPSASPTFRVSVPSSSGARPHHERASVSSAAIPRGHRQHVSTGTTSYPPRDTQTGYPSIISFPVSASTQSQQDRDYPPQDDAAPSDDDASEPGSSGKKHVCPTCFKRFNRPSSLRIHVNTHTGATPFRCPWPNCGREFNVNSNMRRHYRNHTTPGLSRTQQQPDRRRRRRVAPAPPPSAAREQGYMPSPSISEESEEGGYKEEEDELDEEGEYQVRRQQQQVYGKRYSTPGSSFHSSSPSPSPSPPPSVSSQAERVEHVYSASQPYSRSLDTRVSTALRPAFHGRGHHLEKDEKMDVQW